MTNIELTATASMGSTPVSQGKAPADASSDVDSVAFKDLLEAGMPVDESEELLPGVDSLSTVSVADSESASAKKSTSVNLQTPLDGAKADDEVDGSEADAMAGNFAVVPYLQDNAVATLKRTQETLPPLGQRQSNLEPLASIAELPSIAELQSAEVDSASTDFPATLATVDKTMAPSKEHPFATVVAAALTTERTQARMVSSNAETVIPPQGKSVQSTESSLVMPAVSAVNLSDTLNFDAQLQIQESTGLTGEAARPGGDFSLEFGPEGAEQMLGDRANPLSSTQARTPAAMGASLSPSRLDMPLTLQEGTWEKPIGQQLLWMAQHQTQRAELRVDPPHLGPIEVHLSLNDDQAKVTFFSHDAAVRETLENALPKLRELFDSQGIQLNQANVSDQSSARQQSEAGNQSLRQGNTSRGEDAASDNGEAESDHTSRTPKQGDGVVDHFV